MAFGDCLRKNINLLKSASTNKSDPDAFWQILKKIAIMDILAWYPGKVDSDIAIAIYYKILSENSDEFDNFFKETLKSNKQERFRVINRNLRVSNAFHPDGLANQPEVTAQQAINEKKKGKRIIYLGVKEYVDNER